MPCPYRCTATNDYDTTWGLIGATYSYRLLVVTFPTFSIVPNDETYNRGTESNYTVYCGSLLILVFYRFIDHS